MRTSYTKNVSLVEGLKIVLQYAELRWISNFMTIAFNIGVKLRKIWKVVEFKIIAVLILFRSE